jgi:uncharacterized protein (TIGR02646 family)
MIKIERLASPEILTANFEEKTSVFVANPNQKVFDSRSKFYKDILEVLTLMTKEHCSFCDGFPIANTGDAIEHFKPSSVNHDLAYVWENLYYICPKCNSAKGNRFDEKLLRPDEITYLFEKYFNYNADKAILEPASDISEEDKRRAEKTIELYNLNRTNNKKERRRMIKIFKRGTHEKDDFPYRYIIDLGLI